MMMCCVHEVTEKTVALVERLMESPEWQRIEIIEQELSQLEQIYFPLNHIFTKTPGRTGLYTREIFMPAGSIATSRIHLCQSPFVISKGCVSIWCDGGWKTVCAPFTGVTEPGSRRLICVHEDTIWSAFFVTDETDPDKIAEEVTFMGGKYKDLGIAAANPAIQ